MAKTNWMPYDSARVGLSEWEQKRLDTETREKLKEKGIKPDSYISRAGLSIDEQEELGPDTTNRPMHSGPAKGGSGDDYRTDKYLYDAAMQTRTGNHGKLQGGLAGFKDSRSKDYLSLYGPKGPLGPNAVAPQSAGNKEDYFAVAPETKKILEDALMPIEKQPYTSFVGGNSLMQPLRHSNAVKAYKGLRAAKRR